MGKDYGIQREAQMVTANKIKEFSAAFDKIGTELRKNPKKRNYINKEEFERILSKAAIEVCDQCDNYDNCYGGEFSLIYKEAYRIVDKLETEQFLTLDSVPASFIQRCDRLNSMLRELKKDYELTRQNLAWTNRMIDMRIILSQQMEEMTTILQNFCINLQMEENENKDLEKNIIRLCKKYKILVKKVVLYKTKKGRKELYLVARSLQGKVSTEKISRLVGKMIKHKIIPARETKLLLGENYAVLHFVEAPKLQVKTGVSSKPKEELLSSGDNFSAFSPNIGKEIFIAADGMGSGVKASDISKKMLELLETLLETGFREEDAITCANTVVSFGSDREVYTTVDLFSVDTYEAKGRFIKTGGAQTFLKREKNPVEIIFPSTLPAGILDKVEMDLVERNLYRNDLFFMVTDGVLESIDIERGQEKFIDWIEKIDLTNPQRIADYLMEQLWKQCQGSLRDDAMILVVLIE
ncbi:MAG: SpoIIE family protein phosphatase [Lachnospiraceae bacterium]